MADISRDTYNEAKHYDKVILQKNKPWVDADFNESQDIIRQKLRRAIMAAIGEGSKDTGFKIVGTSANNDFDIKLGEFFAKGYIALKTADETYLVQEDNSSPTALTTPGGARTDKVYLHIFEDEIDGTEDPNIIDPTLGSEHSRRTRLRFAVKVAEGGSVPADDATNWYALLATLERTAQAAIDPGMVTDERQDITATVGEIDEVVAEVIAARGSKPSLDERLDVALNEDGTIKDELTTHAELSDMDGTVHDARYFTETEIGKTTAPSGASLVGVQDAAAHSSAANVEAFLAECALISGTPVSGKIAKWDSAFQLVNSILTEAGSIVTVAGNFKITGGSLGAGKVYTDVAGDGVGSWQAPASAIAGHVVEEEGSGLTQRASLNFVGPNVTVTDDAGNDASKVTINADGGDADTVDGFHAQAFFDLIDEAELTSMLF